MTHDVCNCTAERERDCGNDPVNHTQYKGYIITVPYNVYDTFDGVIGICHCLHLYEISRVGIRLMRNMRFKPMRNVT